MPYDKYRNWPLPRTEGSIFTILQHQGLEEQVLRDLAAAVDEIDKLEILDSYAAYAQRAYRERLSKVFSFGASRIIETLLTPNILSRLPEVDIINRGRPVTTKE